MLGLSVEYMCECLVCELGMCVSRVCVCVCEY